MTSAMNRRLSRLEEAKRPAPGPTRVILHCEGQPEPDADPNDPDVLIIQLVGVKPQPREA